MRSSHTSLFIQYKQLSSAKKIKNLDSQKSEINQTLLHPLKKYKLAKVKVTTNKKNYVCNTNQLS